MAVERRLADIYATQGYNCEAQKILNGSGACYSTAAVSLIDAIANDRGEIHIVNVPNRGAVPDLPQDAVVEIACQGLI